MDYKIEMREESGFLLGIAELHWRTKPPTEPGTYWVKNDAAVFSVCIADSYTGLSVFLTHYWLHEFIEEYKPTHWLGPLPIPEPPTKGE